MLNKPSLKQKYFSVDINQIKLAEGLSSLIVAVNDTIQNFYQLHENLTTFVFKHWVQIFFDSKNNSNND